MTKQALIVGIDSMMGSALHKELLVAGWEVFGTTRKMDRTSRNIIFLDLSCLKQFRFDPTVDVVFLCASITSMQACRKMPEYSKLVNVSAQLELAYFFIKRKIHVVFLSTSAVFSGSKPYYRTTEPLCPISLYGRYKADVEAQLMEFIGLVSIVRLTKVLFPNYALIGQWYKQLKEGACIEPFYDLSLCPISINLVTYCLRQIAEYQLTGVIHLSGLQDVTYQFLAESFVKLMKKDLNLIIPQSALVSGIPVEEAPLYTSLDMSHSERLFNISPAPILMTLRFLYKDLICNV